MKYCHKFFLSMYANNVKAYMLCFYSDWRIQASEMVLDFINALNRNITCPTIAFINCQLILCFNCFFNSVESERERERYKYINNHLSSAVYIGFCCCYCYCFKIYCYMSIMRVWIKLFTSAVKTEANAVNVWSCLLH